MYLKNDITGVIGEFMQPQVGWSTPTTAEIDAYLLSEAKQTKREELTAAWENFLAPGYVYNVNTFSIARYKDITNLTMKGILLAGTPDEFKYDDINGNSVDFVDEPAMTLFRKSAFTEWDRVIREKIQYKKDIKACNSISGPATPILNDIVFDFTDA